MNASHPSSIPLHEVFDVLRSGLAALVPVVERVGIPWREGTAYDDWDSIASTLYDQIVVNTIRNTAKIKGYIEFPEYDLIYPSYGGLAYFEIISVQRGEKLGNFVGFEGIDPNFSRVKYAVQNLDGTVDSTTTRSVNFSECAVRLRLPNTEGEYLETVTMSE